MEVHFGCALSTIDFEFCGVSMKGSVVNVRAEELRSFNSIRLQNAVLCAECDVVSDSPHVVVWFVEAVPYSTSRGC
jgi:hypothetical protein